MAGVGIGTFGTTTLGSAKPEKPSLIDRARRIRRKTGSQKKFNRFLKKHGVEYEETKTKFRYVTGDADDVSAQKIKDKHITVTLSHYYHLDWDSDGAFADYRVDVNAQTAYGPGTEPWDHVTLSWPHTDYDLKEDGAYIDNANNATLRSSSFNGADWAWDDQNACGFGCDLWFSMGVKLTKLDSQTPPRKIQGTYQSVWGDESGGLAIGFGLDGSLSFSFSGGGTTEYKQLNREVSKEY